MNGRSLFGASPSPPLEEECIEPIKLAQAKTLFEELASSEFAESEES
ncbi:MAG: hypothetical protein WC553_02215 [Patescibacteria group bacterium]